MEFCCWRDMQQHLGQTRLSLTCSREACGTRLPSASALSHIPRFSSVFRALIILPFLLLRPVSSFPTSGVLPTSPAASKADARFHRCKVGWHHCYTWLPDRAGSRLTHPPAAPVALRSSGRQIAETWWRTPENPEECMGVRSCPVTRERQDPRNHHCHRYPQRTKPQGQPTSSTWSYFKVRYVPKLTLCKTIYGQPVTKGHFIQGSVSIWLHGSLLWPDWVSCNPVTLQDVTSFDDLTLWWCKAFCISLIM